MPGTFRGRIACAALALVCVAVHDSAAQDLVTDRPDFTESSEVVGTGRVQFETGFSLESDGSGRDQVRDISVPSSLVRIGLSPRVELHLSSDGFMSERQGGVRQRGLADVELGAKVKFLNQDAHGVDMAIHPDGVAADRQNVLGRRRRADGEGDVGALAAGGARRERQLQRDRRAWRHRALHAAGTQLLGEPRPGGRVGHVTSKPTGSRRWDRSNRAGRH
ncbi:MAG: hypothetical protein QM736_30050 [Vicinamibacterales bacterium]